MIEKIVQKIICIVIIMLATHHIAHASDGGECGADAKWSYDGNVLVISGSGAMTDFSATVCPWRDYRENITSVRVEEGITYIGKYAFYKCSGLSEISLPQTLTEIGNQAFGSADNIAKINLPDIGAWLDIEFVNATSSPIRAETVFCIGDIPQTDIVIPNGIKDIKKYAFYKCGTLNSVTIPDTVESIGMRAFTACSDLERLVISDGVTEIGNYAFSNCVRLREAVIGANATYLSSYMFKGCTALETVTMSDKITEICADAFTDCTELTDIFYKGTQTQWSNIVIDEYSGLEDSVTVHCDAESVTLYDAEVGKDTGGYVYDFKMKSDQPMTGIFIIVLYNADGRFVMCDTIPVTEAITRFTAPTNSKIATETAATDYKILFWNNLENIRPLSECVSGKIKR